MKNCYRIRNVMSLLFTLLAFLSIDSFADCNTPITRTNFSPNTVLKASDLNSQFNTVYNESNIEVDGDCIANGTIDLVKLNQSELAPILNGIKEGCKVTYNGVSTVNVDRCILSINGNTVRTTTATAVSFGCGDCTAEAPSTFFYVYVKSDSTGTTLNLYLSTVAPTNDGFNGADRVMGRFFNNSSSDIDDYSIDQFHINQFIATPSEWFEETPTVLDASTTTPTKPSTVDFDFMRWKRIEDYMIANFFYYAASGTGSSAGSGTYFWEIPAGYSFKSWVQTDNTTTDSNLGQNLGTCTNTYVAGRSIGSPHAYDATHFGVLAVNAASNTKIDSAFFNIINTDTRMTCNLRFPIEGWKRTGEI